MTHAVVSIALAETDALRAKLFTEHGRDAAAAIAIATAFAMEALTIYRELGGKEMAARQFYALANKEKAPTVEKTEQ